MPATKDHDPHADRCATRDLQQRYRELARRQRMLAAGVACAFTITWFAGAGTEPEARTRRGLIERVGALEGLHTAPVGTIVAFAGEWPPRRSDGKPINDSDDRRKREQELGWMLCDGRQFETSSLPDLRGEFLRGLNYSGMLEADKAERKELRKTLRIEGDEEVEEDVVEIIDPGRTVGHSEQWSTGVARVGFTSTAKGSFNPCSTERGMVFDRLLKCDGQGTINGNFVDATPPGFNGKFEANLFDSGLIPTIPNHRHKVIGGDAETRPRNVAVNYIIKVNP